VIRVRRAREPADHPVAYDEWLRRHSLEFFLFALFFVLVCTLGGC
jgi:hypothetical protein